MGNEQSVVNFQKDLEIVQDKLVKAETNAMHEGFTWPFMDYDLLVHGAPVHFDPDVAIEIGPVVGKVTVDTAIVLLQVDATCTITAYLIVQDHECPSGLIEQKMKKRVEKKEPFTFVFKSLTKNQRYTVVFGGVRKEDVQRRTGRFKTPGDGDLAMLAIAGDGWSEDPVDAAKVQVWKKVYDEVVYRPVDVVLHIGEQVNLKKAFTEAYTILIRHACDGQDSSLAKAGWGKMEQIAYERMQQIYLFEWNKEYTRQVLSSVSNVMIWNDEDIYPGFTEFSEFNVQRDNPTMEMHVVKTVLRAARRAYNAYQRQLWDDSSSTDSGSSKSNIASQYYDVINAKKECYVELKATEKSMIQARSQAEFELAKQIDQHYTKLKDKMDEFEQQLAHMDEQMVLKRGEEFGYELGNVGILALDIRGNRILPDGSQVAENKLINEHQWEFYQDWLHEINSNMLIVICEFPIVDSDSAYTQNIVKKHEFAHSYWSNHQDTQTRMLDLLLQWKQQDTCRNFVILVGKPYRGSYTLVTDTNNNTSFQQISVGCVASDPCIMEPFPLQRKGTLLGRYQFDRNLQPPQKQFVRLEILASGREIIYKNITQTEHALPVLLGPVIGLVTETSAIILLEVERDGVVQCMVRNALTKEKHAQTLYFTAHQPHTFHFTQLTPSQQYEVSFAGIMDVKSYLGEFHTLGWNDNKIGIASVCGDVVLNPLECRERSKESTALWSALASALRTPYCDIDVVLHLGGQVYIDQTSGVHEAVSTLNTCTLGTLDMKECMKKAKHQLRSLYYMQWNLPNVRHVLATSSNIMLWHIQDTTCSHGLPQVQKLVNQLLFELFLEYQMQLVGFDIKNVNLNEVKIDFSQRWNSIGLFCIGISLSLPMIDKEQLSRLAKFFQDENLVTAVIACPVPFVDDSMEDAAEKGLSDLTSISHCKVSLLEVLKVIFLWKKASAKRNVVLLCGGQHVGLDTVLQRVGSSISVEQHCIAPISKCPMPRNIEINGSLGKKYTYSHSLHEKRAEIGLLYVDTIQIKFQMVLNEKCESNNTIDAKEFMFDRMRVPLWLQELQLSKIGIEETIRVFNDIWGTNMDKIRDSYQYVGKIDNNSRPNDVQNMAKRLHQGLVHYCEGLDESVPVLHKYHLIQILGERDATSCLLLDYGIIDEESYLKIAERAFHVALKMQIGIENTIREKYNINNLT